MARNATFPTPRTHHAKRDTEQFANSCEPCERGQVLPNNPPARTFDDVAVITPHFNFAGRQTIDILHRRWHRDLSPALQERHIAQRAGRNADVMWQKEHLINQAVQSLSGVKYVAWIDADIFGPWDSIIAAGIQQLDQGVRAVQLFQSIDYLDEFGDVDAVKYGAVYQHSRGLSNGSPGGAWLCRTADFRHAGGLWQFDVVGGGDQIFSDALLNRPGVRHHLRSKASPAFQDLAKRYAERVASIFNGNVGFVPVHLEHHWHGDLSNRGYNTRWELLKHLNPPLHIDPCGETLRWKKHAPKVLVDGVRDYLFSRREDG